MTELSNTHFKQLQPGESHLFLLKRRMQLYWYSYNYPYGEHYLNKPKDTYEFMTEMMEISSTETVCIFDLVKKIINEMPGKYCLVCSHYKDIKPDYLQSTSIGIFYLNLALISLNELQEKFNNPIEIYLK